MDKIKIMLLPILLGGLLLSQGCAPKDIPETPVEQKPTQVVPTPINDPTQVAQIIDQLELGDDADVSQDGEGEEVDQVDDDPIEPSAQVDHCVECHTNKDMLISTAKVEEEFVSENEGEG